MSLDREATRKLLRDSLGNLADIHAERLTGARAIHAARLEAIMAMMIDRIGNDIVWTANNPNGDDGFDLKKRMEDEDWPISTHDVGTYGWVQPEWKKCPSEGKFVTNPMSSGHRAQAYGLPQWNMPQVWIPIEKPDGHSEQVIDHVVTEFDEEGNEYVTEEIWIDNPPGYYVNVFGDWSQRVGALRAEEQQKLVLYDKQLVDVLIDGKITVTIQETHIPHPYVESIDMNQDRFPQPPDPFAYADGKYDLRFYPARPDREHEVEVEWESNIDGEQKEVRPLFKEREWLEALQHQSERLDMLNACIQQICLQSGADEGYLSKRGSKGSVFGVRLHADSGEGGLDHYRLSPENSFALVAPQLPVGSFESLKSPPRIQTIVRPGIATQALSEVRVPPSMGAGSVLTLVGASAAVIALGLLISPQPESQTQGTRVSTRQRLCVDCAKTACAILGSLAATWNIEGTIRDSGIPTNDSARRAERYRKSARN